LHLFYSHFQRFDPSARRRKTANKIEIKTNLSLAKDLAAIPSLWIVRLA
jgi:hypothetical protein